MKILVTGAYRDFAKLKNKFDNIIFSFVKNEQEELKIDVSSFDYVICNSLFQYNNITNFTSLKYIQVTSAGMDRLPVDYINKHNIKVFNAGDVYSIPMAEWAICKILDIYKKSFKIYNNQINHIWEKQRDIFELNSKNVTIVGYGNVGKELAKRLYAFGTNITVVNRSQVKDSIISKYYTLNNITEGIENADIVISAIALTNETVNLFNEDIFSKMKDNSILVNISRGKVVNTNDLIKYKDKFLGIILDVFENEPLDKNDELWNLNNVIITPHNSFISENNNERLFELVVNNIEGAINEKIYDNISKK